jgi:hypothetical protein
MWQLHLMEGMLLSSTFCFFFPPSIKFIFSLFSLSDAAAAEEDRRRYEMAHEDPSFFKHTPPSPSQNVADDPEDPFNKSTNSSATHILTTIASRMTSVPREVAHILY